jgi:hypothetical protein
LVVQYSVYTTCTFSEDIPWAAIHCDATYVRVLWKLVISLSFMFDKFGDKRQAVDIVCFIIGSYVTYRRVAVGIVYNRSVHYARVLQVFLCAWL